MFGSLLLLFGLAMMPLMNHFAEESAKDVPAEHLYVLKAPVEIDVTSVESEAQAAAEELAFTEDLATLDPAHLLALYLEASTIDGANKVQTFFKVTVPLLRPTTFFILTMSIIGSFQLYDQVLMLTNGNHGTATPVFYIYNMAFGTDGFVGVASAMAVILFFVIMVVTLVMQKFTKETY